MHMVSAQRIDYATYLFPVVLISVESRDTIAVDRNARPEIVPYSWLEMWRETDHFDQITTVSV